MFVPVRVSRTSDNSLLRSGLPVRMLYQSLKEHRQSIVDDAKVRQVKRVQKNKSQLINNNILSTDFQ